MTEETSKIRTITGTVVSNKMDKTIVVLISRKVKHDMYGKYLRRSTKLHAHDANNDCAIGDVVAITPCRPVSKSKFWKLAKIVEKAVTER